MKTSQYRPGRNPNSLKNLKRNTDRDPEELREIGLTEERADEIMRRWDQAMKEMPEPDKLTFSMIQKYRQAGGSY